MYCLSKICCFCLRSCRQLKVLTEIKFPTDQISNIKILFGESFFLELGHVLSICRDCTRQVAEVHSFRQASIKNIKIVMKYLEQLQLGNDFGDIEIQISDIMHSADPLILMYKNKFCMDKSISTASVTEDVMLPIKIEDLKIENEDELECTQELSGNEGDIEFKTSAEEKCQYEDHTNAEYEEREFKIEIHDDFKQIDDPLKCDESAREKEELIADKCETSGKPHKCEMCGKSFTQKGSLTGHMLIHIGKKPHKCETCGKAFNHNGNLRRHKFQHTSEKPHKCETCGKSFTSKAHLSMHVLIHTGEKPHKCETCGKSFTQKGSLAGHMLIHIGKKPHRCEICGKTFNHNGNLRRHMFQHSSDKPHKCETCGKSFTSKAHLATHVLIHTGEKPHKCQTCGKSFTQKGSLAGHMLIHTDEKPHSCEICGKPFNHVGNLKRHVFQHTGENPHTCRTCGKSFSSKSHLKRHMSVHCEKPHK